MFIAFKWLVGLAVAMWAAMCSLDLYLKRNKEINQEANLGFNIKPIEFLLKNVTPNVKVENSRNGANVVNNKHTIEVRHCAMFVAGALAVSLYNRKKEIISYTKNKIVNINFKLIIAKTKRFFKLTAIIFSIAILKYIRILWVVLKNYHLKFKMIISNMSKPKHSLNRVINLALLQKLKEVSEERKKLGQLLIAAIHENKNIRMKYQLESMAKSRMVRNIEDTQKRIKENRTRYVSFQQLYLATNQENIFLKSRIAKLSKEKDDAEKSLMALLHEVYKCKNKELKTYCSRFLVKTRENLLNCNVNSEIQKFLEKSQGHLTMKSVWQYSKQSQVEINATRSRPRYGNALVTEIMQEDCLVPLVSDAPKLKGLPGECIWTVKDKDGIIEKLYEYDYESHFDNGDTIRRIREYSVYHDKDCLLDFVSSKTLIHSTSSEETLRGQCLNINYPVSAKRFLTRSSAFKKFLQSNMNIVSTTWSPALPHRI